MIGQIFGICQIPVYVNTKCQYNVIQNQQQILLKSTGTTSNFSCDKHCLSQKEL